MLQIGDRTFRTKKECVLFIRELVERNPVGKTITGDDDKFLRALILRHPYHEEKFAASPPRHFFVFKTSWNNYCLRFICDDGRRDDMSWPLCIRGEDLSQKQKLLQAFRSAINYEIRPLRQYGKDVHHAVIPYKELVELFLAKKNITYDSVEIKYESTVDDTSWSIADPILLSEWLAFHRLNSTLRVLERKEHQHLKRPK